MLPPLFFCRDRMRLSLYASARGSGDPLVALLLGRLPLLLGWTSYLLFSGVHRSPAFRILGAKKAGTDIVVDISATRLSA
jgi:hypothetical protein